MKRCGAKPKQFIITTLVAVMTLLVVAASADGFGVIEGRAYTPLLKIDDDLDLGGGVALQLGVVPEDTWILGPFIGGHKIFVDGLVIDGQWAGGGSISLKPAGDDNQFRFFGVGWRETGPDRFNGTFGLAYGWNLDVAKWLK